MSEPTTLCLVCEIVRLKENDCLNFEKRLECKNTGRPLPELTLKQVTQDKNKSVNRYFKKTMYDLCDFICGCKDRNMFFCFPCLLFSSTNDVWCKTGVTDLKHLKEKIKKHSLSADHIKCMVSFSALGRVDIRLQLDSTYRKSVQKFNENVTQNRYILNKILNCIKFCGAFELALRGHDECEISENPGVFRGLINFVAELDFIFKDHLEHSKSFKEVSKTIENDLLDSILFVAQDHIKNEVKEAPFLCIQVDETTDSSNNTQMVLIIRYILEGTICERFWNFIKPEGKTANDLAKAIFHELDILGIGSEKLIAQCYDGASVMSGNFGGVQIKIKEKYPNAHYVHCYAHHLNLILQKAASKEKCIRSPKRTEVLDEILQKRFPRAAPTRWYFNTRCVETVFENKENIKICLERIIELEDDSVTLQQATGLLNHLENSDFVYWLNIFHLILPHSEIFNNLQKKRKLVATEVQRMTSHFQQTIQRIRETILNDKKIPEQQKNNKRQRGDLESKKRIALEICDIIIVEIENRFKFSDHLVLEQLIRKENYANFKQQFPEDILELIKVNYPIIDSAKLKTELNVIFDREDFRDNDGATELLKLFFNINLSTTFSETIKLLNILCTIPMTTVESARSFSTLKRIKSLIRNTIGQDRLCALTMLSVEKSMIKNIGNFNELVIDHFAISKERRIDLKYRKM
ncbi:zinc finger MYM-type protein 1-like [Sitophilus oryzae]|uniref:Zinc finger MYM-type protein 1-like n=1 Tax=Sitophilus oryzae TaxID=7048 RepID=A0A6J2Y971_SITOR|nr:zinc finger MYM-type protein 1-like [Sitophilus oryzae]